MNQTDQGDVGRKEMNEGGMRRDEAGMWRSTGEKGISKSKEGSIKILLIIIAILNKLIQYFYTISINKLNTLFLSAIYIQL